MADIDLSRIGEVPRELLERIAVALNETLPDNAPPERLPTLVREFRASLTPPKPLRTRAEVDAELAGIFRQYWLEQNGPEEKDGLQWDALYLKGMATRLNALIREPTREDPELVAAAHVLCGKCPEPAAILFGVCQQHRDAIRDLARDALEAFEPQPERLNRAAREIAQALFGDTKNVCWGKSHGSGEPYNFAAVVTDLQVLMRAEDEFREAVRTERRAKTTGAEASRVQAHVSASAPADPDPVDPRPKCIRCGARWVPDNGLDATAVPCLQCHEAAHAERCGCEQSVRLETAIESAFHALHEVIETLGAVR